MNSQTNDCSNLCSPDELRNLIIENQNPQRTANTLSILDCSWYMPSRQINTLAAYQQLHIEGAEFFQIDEICDKSVNLPHMLPTASAFFKAVQGLGIASQSQVVVYDSAGLFSAARVWWMLRVFGYRNVRVLDGGLPAWIEIGGNVEAAKLHDGLIEQSNSPCRSEVADDEFEMLADKASHLATLDDLKQNCQTAEYLVVDARSRARFCGEAPEPRAGLPSGHMPHSVSLAYDELIDDGRLKSVSELMRLFASRGITADSQLITSCGSGVTAAIITLALDQCGLGMHKLYDGSWSEWASRDDTIILTE